MQGNRVAHQHKKVWTKKLITPSVEGRIKLSSGLSKLDQNRIKKRIVPTDEGPIEVSSISETSGRDPSSALISQLIQQDSRRFAPVLTIDDK